jgi:hypothetical protein
MDENFSPLLDLIVESGADWWTMLEMSPETIVSPTKMELCVSLLRRGTIPALAKKWFIENQNKLDSQLQNELDVIFSIIGTHN